MLVCRMRYGWALATNILMVVTWWCVSIAIIARLGVSPFGIATSFAWFAAFVLLRGHLNWTMKCRNCGTSIWASSGRWGVYFRHYAPDRVCSKCGERT